MKHTWVVLSALLVAALLLSVAHPVFAQEDSDRTGLRFDAPQYAIDGPYAVGVRYFTIPAKSAMDRDLTATVWYPAVAGDPESEFVYEQQFEPGQIPPFSTIGHATLDAEPDSSSAPYPLIIYSHSHWSMGQELTYLDEHLATRGFVVISVDHEDNWSTAFEPIAVQAYLRRSLEVGREIDFAERLSAEDGMLPGLIDTKSVGVTGFSQGAMTALAAAGARLSLEDAGAWCKENPVTAELNPTACADVSGHEGDLATFAGLDEIPEGLWPEWDDDRVIAILALAPSTIPFGRDGISSVDVPIMLMVGSGETATDGGFDMAQPYGSVSSVRKAKVVLDLAEHLVFFSSCDDSPSMVQIGFPMFCSDPVWDMDRAHDLINHFSTAFFNAELKNDETAAAALAPQAVSFPGIEYEAEGYNAEAALAPELVDQIDAYVEEMMASTGLPGFALGVVKDGELAYAQGYGLADVESGEPVTPKTVFQVAEVTYAETAMAVLQLAEQGLIDLDAPITDYLPYFAMKGEGADRITARQLLMHTSGVPDSGDTAADWTEMTVETDDKAVERFVRSLADVELLFPPGEGYEWSDIAYDILGDVVAKVTGKPFEQYMQENVLTPLGMAHSTFLRDEIDPALLASPHIEDDARTVQVAEVAPYSRQFAAANNLHSNVEDMAKLMLASLNHGELDGTRILPAEVFDDMWAEPVETNLGGFIMGRLYPVDMFPETGMGWVVTELDGHVVIHSYGGERGYQAEMMLCPDFGVGVIAMGNGLAGGAIYAPESAIDVLGMVINE